MFSPEIGPNRNGSMRINAQSMPSNRPGVLTSGSQMPFPSVRTLNNPQMTPQGIRFFSRSHTVPSLQNHRFASHPLPLLIPMTLLREPSNESNETID